MQLTTVLFSTQLGDWQPSCACRVVKYLQAELKQCRGHTSDGTASVSKGIRALVLDVCGVLKHFDQVRCILRCHTLCVMPLFHSKHLCDATVRSCITMFCSHAADWALVRFASAARGVARGICARGCAAVLSNRANQAESRAPGFAQPICFVSCEC